MAHFAEIIDGVVVRVVVINNSDLLDEFGVEQEAIGEQYCIDLFGGTWKQTTYGASGGVNPRGGIALRKNYAGEGMTYDSIRDAFISPQPYSSWTLNETTCLWEAPTPMPTDGQLYSWEEATLTWKVI